MEVEAYVRLKLLALSDIVRHKHELIVMDPNGLRVKELTHLLDSTCHLCIDILELVPVEYSRFQMVDWVHKVVHVWSNKALVESLIQVY